MNKRRLSALIILAGLITAMTAPVYAAPLGSAPYIWEADTTFGSFTDKARIDSYLDDLKSHGVNGVWVQVEFYLDGAVNYKKANLSGLPTAEKFRTGAWADDDFLSYVIGRARSRGMNAMIKFHGSNHPAWDKNPGWRKVDSKGKDVLWGGRLKNFCVNSPYWDKIFFPMVREIAASYDVDGFYLDTCQVAYGTDDACFCPYCKARFEKETGQKLPLMPVDSKNWSNPAVKLHAVKRVEWMNKFYESYSQTVEQAKPGSLALLNVSGAYNSYKDALSTRHAGKYVSPLTPEPVNTPRMYAVTRNKALKTAGEKPTDEAKLAMDEIVPYMTRYGYLEFLVKTMVGDGGGKAVVPFSRYWFTDPAAGNMGPVDLEIAQIEAAIGAGAKGYCFFGYLGSAIAKNEVAKTAWADPKFIAYLKDLTSGERAKWIADMQPDFKIAILYDREKDFWTGDYWKRLKSVGGLYSALQFIRKVPAALVPVSEPDQDGFGKSGYKLTMDALSGYDLVIAPGLDYVTREDLQTLKDYVDKGGRLLLMGSVRSRNTLLGDYTTDDAYQMLGVTTVGEAGPSGYLLPVGKHPIFMVPGGFKGPMGSFRMSTDKNAALSYEPKFSEGWTILAHEVTDTGKRPAMAVKDTKTGNNVTYINSDMAAGFSADMLIVLANALVITATRAADVMPVGLSRTASVNTFKSADSSARYIHIFTPDGETPIEFRVRTIPGMRSISAQIINGAGSPEPLQVSALYSNYDTLKLPAIKAPFAMIKIQYEKLEKQ